jgi:hypothetical protein
VTSIRRMTERDDAVRRYLHFLADPSTAIDHGAISAAEAAVAHATDVLDRAKAMSQLERVRQVDGSQLRAAFLVHASGWAADNAVSASVLKELGVSDRDLADAGLVSRAARGKRAGRVGSGARTRTNLSDVQAMIPRGRFTIKDLIGASGASVATVRKAIEASMAAGKVIEHGPVANAGSRGRAPIVYEGL